MLARLKSEFAYLSGMLRVVEARPIHHGESRRRRSATISMNGLRDTPTGRRLPMTAKATPIASSTRAPTPTRAGRSRRGLTKGDAVALMMPNRPEYLAIWFGLAARRRRASRSSTPTSPAPALAHCVNAVEHEGRDRRRALMRRPSPARARSFADAIAVWSHGEAAKRDPRLDLAVAKLSDAPLEAAERPALDDQRRRALHLHFRHDRAAESGAHHPFARVAHHVSASGRASARRAERSRLPVPADVPHQRRPHRARRWRCRSAAPASFSERFSASAFWSDVVRERCTLFVYIGELCRYLSTRPPARASAPTRSAPASATACRPDIFEAFQQRFGIRAVLEFYGSTEGNAVMFNFDFAPRRDRPHSDLGRSRVSR